MPRHAAYLVRWEASEAVYYASDTTHPLTDDIWGTWLAQHRAFAFQGQGGHITVLHEQRQGSDAGYWYAYRREGKRVNKRYAGRTQHVTLARLEELAHALHAQPPAATANEVVPMPPTTSPGPTPLPLLAAKLQPPRLRSGLVPRERLLQRLDAGREEALTLITTPAGFGKTTLVNQWLTSRKVSAFAWLALDAGDSDPARFWRYFIAACQRFAPTIGRAALALLHAATLPPFVAPTPEALMTMLLNDLVQADCQGVLVLEDYHVITEPQIHEALIFFIEHLPGGMHLVLMTRRDPPFPLTRWQAQGHCTCCSAADLSFTSEETAAFLQRAGTHTAEVGELAQIATRLEGWVAGLRMLALALDGDTHTALIRAWLNGTANSHWLFGDYFVAEVLETQSAEMQRFLLMTSGLQRLTGDLCDAVMERTGSAQLLDGIEHAGLFLERLEQDGPWYRFHMLFAEAMQREARRRLGDATLTQASQRASAWFAAHEMLPAAIEAAFGGHDLPRAAQLIERYVGPELFIVSSTNFHTMQEFHTLHGWLHALSESLLRRNPALCMIFAATELMQMQVRRLPLETLVRIEQRLRDAEEGWRRQGNTARLGEVFAFRAMIARERGALREAITWAEQSLAWLPKESLALRSVVRSIGAWYAETMDQSRALILEAQSLSAGTGNRGFVRATLNMHAYILLEMGELHRAEQQFRMVFAEARLDDDHDDIARLDIALAQLHYEWNALDAAWAATVESLKISQLMLDDEVQSYGIAMQARLRHARGETTQALRDLTTMIEHLTPMTMPLHVRLVRELAAHRAGMYLAQGNLAAVQDWWAERDPQHDDIPRSALAYEELLHARLLLAQGQLAEALVELRALADEARRVGRAHFGASVQLWLVVAYMTQQSADEARETMRALLAQTQPEGYLRLFVEGGEMIERCLRDCVPHVREPLLRRYVQRLLAAFAQERGETIPASDEAEALSPQEVRVLRLLVAGQTNPAIARDLVVSVNTVKAHIKNLYRKLGVNNRVAATLAARQKRLT